MCTRQWWPGGTPNTNGAFVHSAHFTGRNWGTLGQLAIFGIPIQSILHLHNGRQPRVSPQPHPPSHPRPRIATSTPPYNKGRPACNVHLFRSLGASLHCALLLDQFPPKSPRAQPIQTPLKSGNPNYPSSRQLQATFPSQCGYITPAFSGSLWWGEINLEKSGCGEQKSARSGGNG